MNRKDTTEFLTGLLKQHLIKKYYAKEVSVDYGTKDVIRIDFLEFQPPRTTFASDIEKGIFICYEVKSCVQDVYSGNGLNFIGEKNYIVTTMETYKNLGDDYRSGKLNDFIKSCHPQNSDYYGFMVAVPDGRDIHDEFENPTPITKETIQDKDWKLCVILPSGIGGRRRSTNELLFCMVRSGK